MKPPAYVERSGATWEAWTVEYSAHVETPTVGRGDVLEELVGRLEGSYRVVVIPFARRRHGR